MKIVPKVAMETKATLGSGNGLALKIQQANTWTNDDQYV